MSKPLLALFFLFSLCSFSQNFEFIPKEFKEIKNEIFFKKTKSDTLILVKRYLENGLELNDEIKDSLVRNKQMDFYTKKYFLNENINRFYIVYEKRSLKDQKAFEVKKENKIFNNHKKYKIQEGTVLKKLNFKDFKDKEYTLDSLNGKVIVLNFWFIGCTPCVKEIPDLNKIQEKFKDKDVSFFAITFDSKKSLNEFVKKKQFDFVLVPESREIINQFYVNSYPTTIIIDKERKIHLIDDLIDLDLMNEIEKMINQYLM